MTARNRVVAFGLIIAALAFCAVGYVVVAATRSDEPRPVATDFSSLPDANAALFINTNVAGLAGRLEWSSIDHPESPRHGTTLSCERAYFAAGRGVCITADKAGTGYEVQLFDRHFTISKTIPLAGIPSRARVSPDGRYGAATTFVVGDSYASENFSTRTVIIDLIDQKIVAQLEEFKTMRDSKVIDAPDVNYWGVTFAPDSNRFYATLGTGDDVYLIEGDIRAKTARTIRDNVQCPSLSPDGARLAFKSLGADGGTRFHVLELATMKDTPLAEPAAIDDQAEWVDNNTVSYGTVQAAVWAVPADGSGTPRPLISNALSPSFQRP